MNAPWVAAVVELAEQIKWWDVQDDLVGVYGFPDQVLELRMASECRHPDAQWLASLLPTGKAVTRRWLKEGLERIDDPRAQCLAWRMALSIHMGSAGLRRAAEMGYAPAQAELSTACGRDDALLWATLAATAGDRRGISRLGECYLEGLGCTKDKVRALELFQQAAALDHPLAQFRVGEMAFGKLAWERYYWWGRASARGVYVGTFCQAVYSLLRFFERRELGRVLHTVAVALGPYFDPLAKELYYHPVSSAELVKLQRLFELHAEMMNRAKRALMCWSMAGRRLRVVKDMRVVIAKMLWAEAWRWGESEHSENEREEEASKKAKMG
jgi:hypothetical protein